MLWRRHCKVAKCRGEPGSRNAASSPSQAALIANYGTLHSTSPSCRIMLPQTGVVRASSQPDDGVTTDRCRQLDDHSPSLNFQMLRLYELKRFFLHVFVFINKPTLLNVKQLTCSPYLLFYKFQNDPNRIQENQQNYGNSSSPQKLS